MMANAMGSIELHEKHAIHELVVSTRGRSDIAMVTIYWHIITYRVDDESAKQVMYKLF
jgi:hypothetical protein